MSNKLASVETATQISTSGKIAHTIAERKAANIAYACMLRRIKAKQKARGHAARCLDPLPPFRFKAYRLSVCVCDTSDQLSLLRGTAQSTERRAESEEKRDENRRELTVSKLWHTQAHIHRLTKHTKEQQTCGSHFNLHSRTQKIKNQQSTPSVDNQNDCANASPQNGSIAAILHPNLEVKNRAMPITKMLTTCEVCLTMKVKIPRLAHGVLGVMLCYVMVWHKTNKNSSN